MKKLLSVMLISKCCWGAFEITGIDARSSALGNSSYALSNGVVSSFLNPAGLAKLEKPEFYLSYSNQFSLAEFSQECIGFGFSYRKIGMGVGFENFGKSDFYQEQRVNFSAGAQVIPKLNLGVGTSYLMLRAEGYPTQDAATFALGFQWQKGKFEMGGVVKNINQPKVSGDEVLRNYNLGILYKALPEVNLMVGLFYDAEFEEQLQLGQEINVSQNLALRAGFQTEPNRYSFGAEFSWSRIEIDYAYVNHPELGGSHNVSMSLKL
jgi:hypothetical protein